MLQSQRLQSEKQSNKALPPLHSTAISPVHQYQQPKETTVGLHVTRTLQKLTMWKCKLIKHFELIFQRKGSEGGRERVRYIKGKTRLS